MRTPTESLLLVYVLLMLSFILNGCKSKETQSLAKIPIQNELEISVPEFANLEIVGNETIMDDKKTDSVLSNLEKIEENIIPIQSKNDLVFKGGETPVPTVKTGNGFAILVSSSRLEVGEPITFYVNTTSALTWQLGDGTSNTGKKISHVFQKPGQYKIEAFNAEKTQRNRIEILVLCSTEYVLNKINRIQSAAYSNDEKALLKGIEEFKKMFKSTNLVIELNTNNQGKGSRKFNDIDGFMDYLLIRTEQNKEKGYLDQAVINGVKQLETSSESSLLSKITLYE
jgi:hypothetical protein